MTSEHWSPLTRDQAILDGWSFTTTGWEFAPDPSGTVTVALDEWLWTDREIRSFMHQTRRLVQEKADAIWDEVRNMPAANEQEPVDVFYDRFGGLLPHEHDWMLFAATIRDAVSAYEIYLTKALDDALRHHGKRRDDPDRTPRWGELRRFYRTIGMEPRPAHVNAVIELRDLLTHRRGELRIAAHKSQFGKDATFFGNSVAHLDVDLVTQHLDTLAESVCELDPVLWAYTYRSHRVPEWTGTGSTDR